MASKYRIFISFAIEDETLRDFLVGQSRNAISPFEFVDMSVKEPWDEDWKKKCRTKIKGCDGVIGIVTLNTPSATGQLWELKCANEEGIPVYYIHGYSEDEKRLAVDKRPAPIAGHQVHPWTWSNIKGFLDSL